jgi:hypothetical protein
VLNDRRLALGSWAHDPVVDRLLPARPARIHHSAGAPKPTDPVVERAILRGSTIVRMLPAWAILITVPAIMDMIAYNAGHPRRCLA